MQLLTFVHIVDAAQLLKSISCVVLCKYVWKFIDIILFTTLIKKNKTVGFLQSFIYLQIIMHVYVYFINTRKQPIENNLIY